VVGAVLQLGPVLGTLSDVAGLAEQLSLRGLFDQDVPRLGEASTDGKDLGRRIDVIELQVLRGSAPYALATQHLDETIAPSLLPGPVVAALICRSIFDHESPVSIYSINDSFYHKNRTKKSFWLVGCEILNGQMRRARTTSNAAVRAV
jgi:hypothetical protein